MVIKVCIVGAGPCGMSAVYQFGLMEDRPEVVCYEKQDTWGGLWNFTWRTGTDEFGEPCHGGMYNNLWSNGPKECLEFPDYTFEQHYGKPIPSFPPRAVLREYLEGRWTEKGKTGLADLKTMVKFNNVVRHVWYDKDKDEFLVTVHDLKSDTSKTETFSHVIIAVGIFNCPNIPEFEGIDTFPGLVIHSHDFRNAQNFKGQRVLVVGASYSAEDMALQCLKFGANNIVCTWRSKPMGFKWPQGIEERPLVQKFTKNTATFRDETTADFDAVILSTGYKYRFPFLDDALRLVSKLSIYPDNLYKGTLWTEGGNRKLFYLGTQDQYFTFTLFEAQALWACKFIMGTLPSEILSVSGDDMKAHITEWVKKREAIQDCHDDIDFQTEFVADLCTDTGYTKEATKSRELFHTWEHQKDESITTYRDQSFASIFTDTMAPHPSRSWFNAFDESVDCFVKNESTTY